jgi:hypothetical protein
MITNRRVIRELPQQNMLQVLPLEKIDIINVVDQVRLSKGNITGVGVRTGNLRTMSYQTAGVGRILGTVIYHANDMGDIQFYGINDPKGMQRLVNDLRKVLLEELDK